MSPRHATPRRRSLTSSPKALAAIVAVLAIALIPAAGLTAAPSILPTADEAALDGLDPTRVFPDPLIAGDFMQYTDGPLMTAPFSYLTGLEELQARHGREDGGAFSSTDICVLMCEFLDDLDRARLEEADARNGADADAIVVDAATGEITSIRSFGGRELPVITVTAPADAEGALPVEEREELYFSMSIHGAERAGLEGGLRYIEDLLIGYDVEQGRNTNPLGATHLLQGGDPTNPDYAEYTITEVLNTAQLHFIAPNPDGWADGDRNDGRFLFHRGNDNGIDLNRQYPTLGWHNEEGQQYNTASEPETIAVQRLIEDYMGTPEGAADLHGEFADNVLLAIMFPAGQFDPLQLHGQYRLAEAIKYNVNNSVHPGAAGLLTNVIEGEVYPAEYHTAYDAIGYDDSGFQGDYLVQQGILEMDHEYIFSNLVPSSVFVPELEQVHVDTTRALLDATIALTLKAYEDEGGSGLGDLTGLNYATPIADNQIGYVFDPEVMTDEDVQNTARFVGPSDLELKQADYSSTNMQYFEDLAGYLGDDSSMSRVDRGELTDGLLDLSVFDTIVVADDSLPVGDEFAAAWAQLRAWAEDGGNLVLTDSALEGLEVMDLVPFEAVQATTQYAGEISEVDTEHPLLDGIGGIIRQTYFEVALGYPPADDAPAWFVDADAWTGTTAATVGATTASQDGLVITTYGNSTDDITLVAGDPAVGTLPVGDGQVQIFGAILPDASNIGPNTHGLADYAVTYAGNGILLNALAGGNQG